MICWRFSISALAIAVITFGTSAQSCYCKNSPGQRSIVYIPPKPNAEAFPKQILRTGVNLTSSDLSPNSKQLATLLKLTPLLEHIQDLRKRVDPINFEATLENIAASQQLTATVVEADHIIQEANLSIEFVTAEISAEQNIYSEILSTYTNNRDKAVFYANAVSFLTNGALWAVGEGLDIPTWSRPKYSISSGTTSILAGVVPSVASIYALYLLNGKKQTSECAPNMLAKLFDYPTNDDIDYPKPVWDFLNAVPVGEEQSRRDQLVDRWISDQNIPNFTSRNSTKQLDILTASRSVKKGLSIATLNTRQVMLQQLSAELLKMKRLLLELTMAVHGEKHI